jgi:hypothetical protein
VRIGWRRAGGRYDRDLLETNHRAVECARNRRRAHRQQVSCGPVPQLGLVGRSKALFLVDDDEPEPRVTDILCQDRGRTDDDPDRSIRKTCFYRLLLGFA